MSPASDPLRNTLDQLALDPRAKDDRKYLVSVLRRLGYSEQEIREALGIGGEEGRLIEVEYTGKGPAVITDELGEEETDEGGFTVVEDEPDFEHDAPVFQETDGWSEEWDEDDAWEPTDEPADDEEVEFQDMAGDEPPERVAFAVRRGRLDTRRIPPARGGQPPAAPPDQERDWQAVDRPEEGARSGDIAVQAGWEPVDAQGLEEDTDEDWGAPEEAPGQSWEPVDEDAAEWDEVPAEEETSEWSMPGDEGLEETTDDTWQEGPEETAWETAPDETSADDAEETWESGPMESPADAGGAPFQIDDYTLYTRDVELSTGREQTIYFFAKSEPRSGRPAALPDGYAVERNDRTGLPYLRRQETRQPKPDRPVYSGSKKGRSKPSSTKTKQRRCHAVTQGGSQCKNHARQSSKYCGIHKNWRGPKVE